jgi:hypothetical protein
MIVIGTKKKGGDLSIAAHLRSLAWDAELRRAGPSTNDL